MEENKVFEEDMIVLVDEDGTEISYELVAALDVEGKTYFLLAENPESDDVMPFEYIEGESEEDIALMPVEDEETFNKIAEAYDALFDEDGCECGCCDHDHK